MTIDESIRNVRSLLTPAVGADEARAMAYAIHEDIKEYSRTRLMAYGDRELLPETSDRIARVVTRILAGEPMQYATGKAHWRGRVFGVNDAVLIPRPETSQLVDMITDTYGSCQDLRILDIGTGSGCIAISLALDLPFSKVTAIDISEDALTVARENAHSLKAKVNFLQADAFDLSCALPSEQFDIIVSNPPYILESERKSMDTRVSEHEPHQALFVSDSAPIAIYEAIARYAAAALSPGGKLYLEINPLCADILSKALVAEGLADVLIIKDYLGAERFAIATKRK